MGYIGNQPADKYTTFDKQTITGDGGTGYTLDHAVANAQEIEVFVNNVRQEPGVAYTVSGTTLTMTGNVASTDDFYVVYQGKAIQTVVPADDTITTAMLQDGAVDTTQLADDAVTAAKVDSTLHLSTIKDSTGTNNAITIDSSGDLTFSGSNTVTPTDSGWITPTLNSGYAAYDEPTFGAIRYRKIGKLVEVTGLLEDGTVGVVFTLPTGYRPSRHVVGIARNNNGNDMRLDVKSNGDVEIVAAGDPTVWASVHIMFFID